MFVVNTNMMLNRASKSVRDFKVVIYLILNQIRNARNPLNGNVLISRDDEIARSCIARESVIETGAQQKPAHVINKIPHR